MVDLNNIKQVHCIGIGGIGLSGIAHVLMSRGYIVTGSDMNQNDTVRHLMDEGARIVLGHRAKNVLLQRIIPSWSEQPNWAYRASAVPRCSEN